MESAVRSAGVESAITRVRVIRGVESLGTKISFGEMRDSSVRGLLIYCADYRCSHSIAISGDGWPDYVRLSDIEPSFICGAPV